MGTGAKRDGEQWQPGTARNRERNGKGLGSFGGCALFLEQSADLFPQFSRVRMPVYVSSVEHC